MGKMKEDIRHKIICLRVSREDYRFLTRLSKRENVCVSDLMREALQHVMESFLAEPEPDDSSVPELLESLEASFQ